MRKSINQRIIASIMAIVTLCVFSVNIAFAKTEKFGTNVNDQKLVKIFENDEYIMYGDEDSSEELIIQFPGEGKARVPNHVGTSIVQIDGNRVRVVSKNYGIDTVDRVRIRGFLTNTYGYNFSTEVNEYRIMPLFYRTNIFLCYDWQTMSFTVDVWDGGQHSSGFRTIVRKR